MRGSNEQLHDRAKPVHDGRPVGTLRNGLGLVAAELVPAEREAVTVGYGSVSVCPGSMRLGSLRPFSFASACHVVP